MKHIFVNHPSLPHAFCVLKCYRIQKHESFHYNWPDVTMFSCITSYFTITAALQLTAEVAKLTTILLNFRQHNQNQFSILIPLIRYHNEHKLATAIGDIVSLNERLQRKRNTGIGSLVCRKLSFNSYHELVK